MEMRQNTRMMQAQIRQSITDTNLEYLGWLATAEHLSEALATVTGGGSLSDQQSRAMNGFLIAQLRAWENEHYQNKIGLFTQEEFGARRSTWQDRLQNAPHREEYWRRWFGIRDQFAPDFRAEIDAIIAGAQQAQ